MVDSNDPLLTSLCSICHVLQPRYKCPRCSVRTCSVACIRKHKAWSECTGLRDATAYIPPSKLRTPAGIDHDYNFLKAIEITKSRTEKVLIEEKGLVCSEELQPVLRKQVQYRTGRDGRSRRVLVTRMLKVADQNRIEKHLFMKLRWENIEMVRAPHGFSRNRENKTSLNRRTGRINWQVEWLVFDAHGEPDKPTRVLSKVLDDRPLCDAAPATVSENTAVEERVPGSYHHSYAMWPKAVAGGTGQDFATGKWTLELGATDAAVAEQRDDRSFVRFFLARPRLRSDAPNVVTPLEPHDTLRDALRDTRVLEFPSLYVLPGIAELPLGVELGAKDGIPTRAEAEAGWKRRQRLGGEGETPQRKRVKAEGERVAGVRRGKKNEDEGAGDMEDGEVKDDDKEDDGDEDDGGCSDGGSRGPGFLGRRERCERREQDEVRSETESEVDGIEEELVAEESLGEEFDEDDETSSSGSDSEWE